jgi:hypothetical protein
MSGRLHNKGVLILTGFMCSRFAQNKPLGNTAVPKGKAYRRICLRFLSPECADRFRAELQRG